MDLESSATVWKKLMIEEASPSMLYSGLTPCKYIYIFIYIHVYIIYIYIYVTTPAGCDRCAAKQPRERYGRVSAGAISAAIRKQEKKTIYIDRDIYIFIYIYITCGLRSACCESSKREIRPCVSWCHLRCHAECLLCAVVVVRGEPRLAEIEPGPWVSRL